MNLRLRRITEDQQARAHYKGTLMLEMKCPGREEDPLALFEAYVVLEQWDKHRGGWFPIELTDG